MAEVTIYVCDLCGAEKRGRGRFCGEQHHPCSWEVIPDGYNGEHNEGTFRGLLCEECRRKINGAIREVVYQRREIRDRLGRKEGA